MPFRSGITFLKTLRKSDNKQIANLPVIIVSAEESTSVEDQLTELDVNGFVEKPIKLELLQSEIIDALVND